MGWYICEHTTRNAYLAELTANEENETRVRTLLMSTCLVDGENEYVELNKDRAQWAAQVVDGFSSDPAGHGSLIASPFTVQEEDVIDLLSDMMHLCRVNGMDFDILLGTSRLHFDEEVRDESLETTKDGEDHA